MEKLKAALISLGCPKNQVDAEMLIARLEDDGFVFSDMTEGNVDVVIVNTCGFIDEAKKEAIENILDAIEMKKNGETEAVVVTGCLTEVYKEEILKEFPEIDAVVGIGANGDIAKICTDVVRGNRGAFFEDKENLPLNGARHILSPDHWAYLKVAEGCSNRCTYCAIPDIRGDFRSRKEDEIIFEAQQLASAGVKELIVVAQDTTRYGIDLYGEYSLHTLIQKICEATSIPWIRLLYCYPDKITDELIAEMRDNPRVVKYIDIPLQHISDPILKHMNRRGNSDLIKSVIKKLRDNIPEISIRTTFIVGFPGENEEDFERLAEFIKEARFEHCGVFTYSREEDTPAYNFDNQIDEQVKQDRMDILMKSQLEINYEQNKEMIGKTIKVLCEDYDPVSETHFGRSQFDAPEIDGKVFFKSEYRIAPGSFVNVKVRKVVEYDLYGFAVTEK